jgi:hypothetical protein
MGDATRRIGMKRLWTMMSLAALLVVLSGCVIFIGLPPLYNLRVFTDFRYPSTDRSFICDTLITTVTYQFDYSPELISWISYLYGPEGKDSRYIIDRDITDPFPEPGVSITVSATTVRVDFEVLPRSAPQAIEPQITPGIPPTLLVVRGRIVGAELRDRETVIPIDWNVGDCPAR